MFKKMISTLIALLITVSVTTNAYAKEGVLDKISAGVAKKVSVSADAGKRTAPSDNKMIVVKEEDKKSSDNTSESSSEKVDISAGSGESVISESSNKAEEKAEEKTTDENSDDSDEDKDPEKGSETESEKQQEKESEDGSDHTDDKELCVANVDDSMNVRAEATEDSAVVGYLYTDCVGEIIERKDGWTRVRSGVLEGWAKDDYLLFGDDAKKITDNGLMEIAVINADRLRIRSEASEEASIKAMLSFGDEVEIIGTEGDDWTKISFEDGTNGEDTGYVSNDYITKKTSYKTGETKEQAEEREEKSNAAKEAAKKAKEEKKSEAKSEDGDKDRSSGEVKISTEELEAASSSKTEASVTDNGAVSASVDDETLLAALIQCECNGPYESQLAVGAVVVNRAKGGYGSISNAVYAPAQFGPASSGKLARTIATGAISATARQAAHDAISGLSNVGNAKYFRNISSGHEGIVIGNHVYW